MARQVAATHRNRVRFSGPRPFAREWHALDEAKIELAIMDKYRPTGSWSVVSEDGEPMFGVYRGGEVESFTAVGWFLAHP